MSAGSSRGKPPAQGNGELVHARVLPLRDIRPAPENDEIYRSISVDDVLDLVTSIREHGLQEPLLVSARRLHHKWPSAGFAARIVGLSTVPVRIHSLSRQDDYEAFVKLLVETNIQRIKGTDVLLHEAAIKIDPLEAHAQLVVRHIAKQVCREKDCCLEALVSENDGTRCRLSSAKAPLLKAIARIVKELRDYWPLSMRRIHYRLLGENAPLIHASKPHTSSQNL